MSSDANTNTATQGTATLPNTVSLDLPLQRTGDLWLCAQNRCQVARRQRNVNISTATEGNLCVNFVASERD